MTLAEIKTLARQKNTVYVGAAFLVFCGFVAAWSALVFVMPKGTLHDQPGFGLVALAFFAPGALLPAMWVCLAAAVWAVCPLVETIVALFEIRYRRAFIG